MKIIICIDDNKGMLFNKRRQSQDSALREDIIENLQGARLWMNSYSFGQYKAMQQECIMEDESFMEHASEEDYCFVENISLLPYETEISELIIYRWNRKYPSDTYLEIDLSCWELTGVKEFRGSSHEKITRETYKAIR